MMEKNTRTAQIAPAPIQKLISEVRAPQDLISLGQGVPFFPPPPEAIDAFVKSATTLGFRYSEDAGIPELREAIARKVRRQNRINAIPDKNIMVTAGGNQAFVNAILAITKPGDEVILVAPYYFNHFMGIQIAGCTPIIVHTGANFLPNIEEIEKKITAKTRAIVTVSPNNPTGQVYSEGLLRKINEICRNHGIYHISDEAYEDFVFEDAHHHSPASLDTKLTHTISLFSFSKSYSMGGYRVGYMIFPASLYEEILKVQDTIGICPPVPSQHAALAAINVGNEYPKKFLPEMDRIRKMFIEVLKDLPVELSMSKGAFYIYLRFPSRNGRKKLNDWKLAIKMIEKHGVMAIPASVFGDCQPGFRISFGNVSEKDAQEGIKRFVNCIRTL